MQKQKQKNFATPNQLLSTWQILSTIGIFTGLIYLLSISQYVVLNALICLLLIGIIIRIMILQHDLGHYSCFKSKKVSNFFGNTLSAITGIPFHAYRISHNWHHKYVGNLDNKEIDEFYNPMLKEDALKNPGQKKLYSLLHRGSMLFLVNGLAIGLFFKPPFLICFHPKFNLPFNKRDIVIGIILNTLAQVMLHIAIFYFVGFDKWLYVVILAYFLAGGILGILLYVQHFYEHTYFDEEKNWSYQKAAIIGSSYLELPYIFRWFTADISIHHVHHLNPKIPNYNLEAARLSNDTLANVKPLSLSDVIKSFTYIFWDREQNKMIEMP